MLCISACRFPITLYDKVVRLHGEESPVLVCNALHVYSKPNDALHLGTPVRVSVAWSMTITRMIRSRTYCTVPHCEHLITYHALAWRVRQAHWAAYIRAWTTWSFRPLKRTMLDSGFDPPGTSYGSRGTRDCATVMMCFLLLSLCMEVSNHELTSIP